MTRSVGTTIGYAVTLGTSSSQAIGIPTTGTRRALTFHNPSTTATVSICPAIDNNGNALAAVAGGAGTVTILPLSSWEVDGPCENAWNAISSAVSTPFTVWEFII